MTRAMLAILFRGVNFGGSPHCNSRRGAQRPTGRSHARGDAISRCRGRAKQRCRPIPRGKAGCQTHWQVNIAELFAGHVKGELHVPGDLAWTFVGSRSTSELNWLQGNKRNRCVCTRPPSIAGLDMRVLSNKKKENARSSCVSTKRMMLSLC